MGFFQFLIQHVELTHIFPRLTIQAIPDATPARFTDKITSDLEIWLIELPTAHLAFWDELESYVAIVDAGRKEDKGYQCEHEAVRILAKLH
jgi:hypothetical protein